MDSFELPGYDVLDLLGSSGSGEVWRGRDGATGELVALKRVRCVGRDVSRQLREQVSHVTNLALGPVGEHLVRVRASVPVVDGLVLVLDHAAGGSLGSVLGARGRLAPGEVVTVGVPIAGVLATLHAAGLVHGNVSAANVVFTLDGRPLLADVGVARLLRPAPEAAPAGPPDDVYALAALCWTALGGTAPAPGAAPPATPAGVPSALAAAVRRGLVPDPAARPAAAAWGAAVRAACAPAPVRLARRSDRPDVGHSVPAGTPPPTATGVGRPASPDRPSRHRRGTGGNGRTRRPPRRLLGRAFAAAMLALAAVALGTALSRVDRESTASPLPRASSTAPSAAAASPAASPADWRQVLAGLDARRTEAFARGESLALARVYAPGSAPLARDTDALRRLAVSGITAPGLRLEVSEVRAVSAEPERVVLRVVDRLPAHDLIARDGTVREHRAGRGPQAWQIVLVPSSGEWRIAAVDRLAS